MRLVADRRFLTALVVGLIALGCVLGWLFYNQGNGSLSAQEAGREAREQRDALLSSLTEGSVLYQKYRYVRQLSGPYPSTVVQESWGLLGEGAILKAEVTKTHDEDGNLVATSKTEGDTTIFNDLISGQTLTLPSTVGSDLDPWLTHIWALPQKLEDGGYTAKGNGTLNGRESVIYEVMIDVPADDAGPAGARRREIELISDAPLLHRTSTYDGSGTLLSETTLLEYRVVDAMPELQ